MSTNLYDGVLIFTTMAFINNDSHTSESGFAVARQPLRFAQLDSRSDLDALDLPRRSAIHARL